MFIETTVVVHLYLSSRLMNRDTTVHQTRAAIREINRELPVRLRISSIEVVDVPQREMFNESPVLYLKRILDTHGEYSEGIHLYLVEPEENFIGQDIIRGAASGICPNERVAYATPSFERMFPWDSARLSKRVTRYTIMHELLHLLGATHDERRLNVMRPGLPSFVRERSVVKILKRAKTEVKKCLKN